MIRLAVIALASLMALSSCAPDEAPPDEEQQREPEAEELAGVTEWQQCTNPVEGYTVQYPADWQTNDGATLPECSVFDPEPIEVEPHTVVPYDVAVQIRLEPMPLDTLARPRGFVTVLAYDSTRVDGRRAIRTHTELAEEGIRRVGSQSYEYLIDLNGQTLIAATHDVGEPPFEVTRRILDDMMQRLRFGAPDAR